LQAKFLRWRGILRRRKPGGLPVATGVAAGSASGRRSDALENPKLTCRAASSPLKHRHGSRFLDLFVLTQRCEAGFNSSATLRFKDFRHFGTILSSGQEIGGWP
jgi:hypothetical protein